MNDTRELRDAARSIFDDALAAADARRALLEAVRVEGAGLRVFDERFDARAKVYSVAVGKAAAAMASGLEERLGDSLAGGVLSAPPSGLKLSTRWRVFEGGHPLPNEASMEAARAAFELLDEADASSALVLFLVSGGGSAMLEQPRGARVTLEDLREANRLLVSCGAAIDEVNAVRRALSAVKGGGLSLRAPRATQVTLIVSDVPRGRERDVASGPTLAPPPDSPHAREVVARYGLDSKLPDSIKRLLEEEAPRAADGDARSSSGSRAPRSHYVLLDNDGACEAAAESARSRGFAVERAPDISEQPVGEGASLLASRLFEAYARDGAGGRGVCLVSGGEFACPVRGGGTGGRNSETALRCAFEFERALGEREA
ncbi:MAG TPA: glycerate kinase, partial [Pyrinomonadaceae bacterium]|nr:glycerate kinase [Pyrinomonadaceae bacterium]